MDLTKLSDEEVQILANVGNIAALAELNRRSSLPNAIERDIMRDQQGNIRLVNIPRDDLMSYNEFYNMPPEQSRGILELFKDAGSNVLDFIGSGGLIGRGIRSLGNLLGDTFKSSRFYNPRSPISGERIFAPGSRAGDPFNLNMRRDAASISRMLTRQAQDKAIGETRLNTLMNRFNFNVDDPTRSDYVDTDAMSDSIAASAQTGYGIGDVGNPQDQVDAGRDYSESPGAMAGDMEYGEE
tara:strand:- start:34 stop:753 length:720 start_codon:yes stop_codon:yes gene_type:complete